MYQYDPSTETRTIQYKLTQVTHIHVVNKRNAQAEVESCPTYASFTNQKKENLANGQMSVLKYLL